EECEFAGGLDHDASAEVAFGDRGGDLGDRADLGSEIRGEAVDVVGEILPRAGGAGDVRLAAEPALDADLAGDGRDLVGECRQGADHVVYGVGEFGDFALCFDRQRGTEVAVGDGGDDPGDAADLVGEVGGHQ